MNGWTPIGELTQEFVLRQQIAEMKKALRFYAAGINYATTDGEVTSAIERDEGDLARQVLRKLGALA